MDKIKTTFLEILELQPLVLFRYSYSIFYMYTWWARSSNLFAKSYRVPCWHQIYMESFDLEISVKNSKIITDLYVKSTDQHKYLHYLSAHPNNYFQSLVRLCILVGCTLIKNHYKT